MTVTSREKKNLMQYHVIDSDECAAKERFEMRTPLYVKYEWGMTMMDRKKVRLRFAI